MKILYAWEIGEDLGHIVRFAPIAQALRIRGVELSFALCDLSRAHFLKLQAAEKLYQSPFEARRGPLPRRNCSYPQLLFNHGFAEESVLVNRLRAWRLLLERDQPDIVLCDLAPTAQLAAQSFEIQTVVFGDGFGCPPNTLPMPLFLNADESSHAEALQDEHRINTVLESVCKAAGTKTNSLQDLQSRTRLTILSTYPEFDPYGPRSNATYVGSWADCPGDEGSRHPAEVEVLGPPPEVFCYLKYQPGMDFIAGTLALLNKVCQVYMPGAPAEFVDYFTTSKIQILNRPVDLRVLAKQITLAVTHGNHGTTSYLASQGIPVIMLPMHAEQWSHSLRAQKSNLGRIVEINKLALFPRVLAQSLTDFPMRKSVSEFAMRATQFPSPIEAISDALVALDQPLLS